MFYLATLSSRYVPISYSLLPSLAAHLNKQKYPKANTIVKAPTPVSDPYKKFLHSNA